MITVYYKENCGQCKVVKRFLDTKGIEYKAEFVGQQDYGKIREKFGVEALPVTEFPDGFVTGANIGEITKHLKSNNLI